MSDPRAPFQRHDPREGTPDLGGSDAEQENAASALEADNPVEEDTLETIDPDNAPA